MDGGRDVWRDEGGMNRWGVDGWREGWMEGGMDPAPGFILAKGVHHHRSHYKTNTFVIS